MSYTVTDIQNIIKAGLVKPLIEGHIAYLLTDSRSLSFPEQTLFFALPGPRRNGNSFIAELYEKGVRNFVLNSNTEIDVNAFPKANLFFVEEALHALQTLAKYHRETNSYPVIGITGSNGKTIIKEWLYQLLHTHFKIVRNPKSYNSQVGVPLSVWQMKTEHNLGIFEAGISLPNEMALLQEIIQPEIGVLGFMGDAHAEGFSDFSYKLDEKLQLFKCCKVIVYCSDDSLVKQAVDRHFASNQPNTLLLDWSKTHTAKLAVVKMEKSFHSTKIECSYQNKDFIFTIPFTDEASIYNALTCCAVMLYLNTDTTIIQKNMLQLKPVSMRLELKKGVNQCSIINDSYNNDIDSLKMALDFLEQQEGNAKKTVILSDIYQSGINNSLLYGTISKLLKQKKVYRFIGIGSEIETCKNLFSDVPHLHFYASTSELLKHLNDISFFQETILLKGARAFEFESVASRLEEKLHDTVLEINLSAIRRNLQLYRNSLNKSVKLMAMVKAFSYGSGSHEIASLLQNESVDYLAVAYADEGVELRKAGIQLPIMVMNPSPQSFDAILENCLEPELFSFSILHQFSAFLQKNNIDNYTVHLKLDTGMHRLGFMEEEMPALTQALQKNKCLKIKSIFSHLVASEQPEADDFTNAQADLFRRMSASIENAIGYTAIKHLCNTSAIKRHSSLQFDMVRLGIGLYGIDALGKPENVTTLKTTIAQIKHVRKGESVGYGRKALLLRDSFIATVRIGYADGYSRSLGNGKGCMYVNGQFAPVVGNVCMDMTMLDVTDISNVQEGEEVIVFGEKLPVQDIASWSHTIPYEILTNVSQRVKRIYYEE